MPSTPERQVFIFGQIQIAMRSLLFLLILLLNFSLLAQKNALAELLQANADHPKLAPVLEDPTEYDVQLIYVQIDRDERNRVKFTWHNYGVDAQRYFYPASSIKMPIAFLALEKMNKLGIVGLDKHSVMTHGAGHPPQTAQEVDSSSATGLPSLAHYVKKLFIVSDNDAYNRLFEFLGQRYINEMLWDKGFRDVKITHRVGIGGFGVEENRYTNPVSFYQDDDLLYHQGEVYGVADRKFDLTETLRGKGQMRNDSLVNEPFDFSTKNYISLRTLLHTQIAVIFPETFPLKQQFELTDDDYRMLYQYMSELPRESAHPNYSKPDNYGKFFIFGDQPEDTRIPENIRIFNKVGWAYGFLTDVSYIVDFESGAEFFLAANIHVSANGVYNDGVYEYEEIGLPFLAEVGRIVFEYDKNRKREFPADLSKFRVEKYD